MVSMRQPHLQAWDIDLEDYTEPSLATKNYIEFLNQITGAPPTSSGASLAVEGKEREPSLTDALDADRTSSDRNVFTSASQAESSGRGGMCRLKGTEASFERRGDRESHVDTAEKSPQDSGEGRGSEEAGSPKEEAGSSSQRDRETSGARIIAAMVPCMRLYAFLGAELSQGRELEGHPYREWIETYASPAFQVRNALWLRSLGTQYVFFSAEKGRMAVWRIMYLMFPRLELCFLSVLSDGCSLE